MRAMAARSDLLPSSSQASRFGAGWPHWLALAAAAMTWPLLLVGGAVTVYRVGMAVPDWPTTYGSNMFLYNMFEAPWGVFAEHAHRLYASVVGLACIGVAGVFSVDRLGWRGLGLFATALLAAVAGIAFHADRVLGLSAFFSAMAILAGLSLLYAVWFGAFRRDLAACLAWLALAAVVGQGVLGGYRVRANSTTFAMIHGCLAQAVFGLLVVLCVVTGRRWAQTRFTFDRPPLAPQFGIAVIALTAAQIVAGAYVRHFGTNAAVAGHAGLAIVVSALAFTCWLLAVIGQPGFRDLARIGHGMAIACAAQVLLGVAAWLLLQPFDGIPRSVTSVQALVRVGHQGIGALLFASSIAWVLHAFRTPLPGFSERAARHDLPITAAHAWGATA